MSWVAGMNTTNANKTMYMGENGMCITATCWALNALNANQDCAHLSVNGVMVGNSDVPARLSAPPAEIFGILDHALNGICLREWMVRKILGRA
jgi:hypothetical protein